MEKHFSHRDAELVELPEALHPAHINQQGSEALACKTLDLTELCQALSDIPSLRVFMQNHIFAVWDFMMLLKTLQNAFTCVQPFWGPSESSALTRIINEIVLQEESDEVREGVYISHFAWYRQAMLEIGADVRPMDQFLHLLRHNSWNKAIKSLKSRAHVQRFLSQTRQFSLLPPHQCLAAFLYGRELLIPALFEQIRGLLKTRDLQAPLFMGYLERHIEIDGNSHGPLAQQALDFFVSGNEAMRRETLQIGALAQQDRQSLINGIVREIRDFKAKNGQL